MTSRRVRTACLCAAGSPGALHADDLLARLDGIRVIGGDIRSSNRRRPPTTSEIASRGWRGGGIVISPKPSPVDVAGWVGLGIGSRPLVFSSAPTPAASVGSDATHRAGPVACARAIERKPDCILRLNGRTT